MSHQAALSMELQASVDAFLRTGGTITKLNYAGVPIDDEYGRPVHVPARAEAPAPEHTVRTYTVKPAASTAAAEVAGFVTGQLAPRLAAINGAVTAFIAEVLAPEPEPRCFYTELRALRADAQRTLAQLNRLVESV